MNEGVLTSLFPAATLTQAVRKSNLSPNYQEDIRNISQKIYFDAKRAEAIRQEELSYQAAQERAKYANIAGSASSQNAPKPLPSLSELNRRWESYHRTSRRNGYRQSFDQWSKRFGYWEEEKWRSLAIARSTDSLRAPVTAVR